MGLVVANKYKGEIKSIADLKGRPVGVTSPGSQTHMVLGYLLAKNGVKADEVKIIGAGGNTMPLAIEKDSVHAGMMVDPFFTVFLKQGKGYALVDMFTTKGTLEAMGGEVQGTTLLTRPDVIAKRPATVQKMVNALVKANKLITSLVRRGAGQDAPQGASRRPEALRRVVRARARGVPARLARQPGRRRPRHRDHARVRRRPGRHEDRAGEPVRQPVRAEGPGALESAKRVDAVAQCLIRLARAAVRHTRRALATSRNGRFRRGPNSSDHASRGTAVRFGPV